MGKYSVLFEADEYRQIGPFRFPVYKDFTPGESREFERLNKSFARGTYASMQLASRIAKEHNMKPSQALEILGQISAPENQDYLFEYAEAVQGLADGVITEEEKTAQLVTFFLQKRGELQEDGVWHRISDWSADDTDSIPGQIIREIHEFMMWERNGWPTPEGAEGNEQSPSSSRRSRIPLQQTKELTSTAS